jgi:phosphoserine phosphatase RsbU/P
MAKDVTERKQAEAQLAEFAGELRRKNELLEEDLEMARELQNAMLPQQYPRFPATASEGNSAVQFCHFYQSSMLVSGDFFDVFRISDSMVGVFICDVMGHGVRAALVAAMLRTLASELREAWERPGELLAHLNRKLCGKFSDSFTPIFASAFYLVVDFGAGELCYANAGHPHPLRLQRAGRFPDLHALNGIKPGPALGLFNTAHYKSWRCELRPYDIILLFIDGLFEVEGLRCQYFDYHNLLQAVGRLSSLPTPELCQGLIHEVQQFSLSKEFTDDVCLVALEVNGISGQP